MKKLYFGFIALFFLLSLTLSVGMLFAGPAQPMANEVLAEPPAATTPEGGFNDRILADTAKYVGDHFFLRQQLISLDRRLNASLLGTSGQDSVLLGKDGWLYFRDTLNDYTGVDPLTDRQLSRIAHNLALMNRYCAENGKQFLFVIAPNKNALYGENMPNFGAPTVSRASSPSSSSSCWRAACPMQTSLLPLRGRRRSSTSPTIPIGTLRALPWVRM